MSKTKVIEIVTDSGLQYGQISHPNDFIKSQEYAHQHVESLTKDFLIGANAETAGCGHTLPGGLNINIAAGRCYHDGVQFDAAAANLTLAAAHATHPRLDYIVATISGSVPAETQFIPFQRLRTSQELIDGDLPYPPTQFSRATEKHNIAQIQVRTGTPAASPLPPSSVGTTDVILYSVLVPANTTVLQTGNVTDTRILVANARQLKEQQATASANIGTLQTQMAQALAFENLTRPFSQFGGNSNLLGILNEIYAAIKVLEVRYPTILSNDCRCPANVVDEDGDWVIDIPVGTAVEFGAKFVGIYAENFPNSANARYVTVSDDEPEYLPILEGRDDFKNAGNNEPSGNYIRFDMPGSTKALYMLVTGELVFRSTVTPSTSVECLLMKITPKNDEQPILKRYLNQRNFRIKYTKTADLDATSKQFEWNLAIPPTIASFDCYGVRANDGTRYDLPIPNINFDESEIDVSGVQDGDDWYLIVYNLSAL